VVIDGRGEVSGVLVLADQRQAEDVGVVFGLLCDVGQLVAGNARSCVRDHAILLLSVIVQGSYVRGIAPDDVDQDRIVLFGKPMSMQRW